MFHVPKRCFFQTFPFLKLRGSEQAGTNSRSCPTRCYGCAGERARAAAQRHHATDDRHCAAPRPGHTQCGRHSAGGACCASWPRRTSGARARCGRRPGNSADSAERHGAGNGPSLAKCAMRRHAQHRTPSCGRGGRAARAGLAARPAQATNAASAERCGAGNGPSRARGAERKGWPRQSHGQARTTRQPAAARPSGEVGGVAADGRNPADGMAANADSLRTGQAHNTQQLLAHNRPTTCCSCRRTTRCSCACCADMGAAFDHDCTIARHARSLPRKRATRCTRPGGRDRGP